MSLISLLKKNPTLLSKYVSLGLLLVDKTVTPLNSFMKHLMDIQDIDPNTQPGERARRALVQALDDVKDPEDFDKDYDFTWFAKQFEKARGKMANVELTREKFRQLTDVSGLGDAQTDMVNSVAPESIKREIRLTNPDVEKENVDVSRQAAVVGRNRRSRHTSRVVKSFNGNFRRVVDK